MTDPRSILPQINDPNNWRTYVERIEEIYVKCYFKLEAAKEVLQALSNRPGDTDDNCWCGELPHEPDCALARKFFGME